MSIESLGKQKNKNEWHDWFAWYPCVVTDAKGNKYRIFMERVKRRFRFSYDVWWREYFFIKDGKEICASGIAFS